MLLSRRRFTFVVPASVACVLGLASPHPAHAHEPPHGDQTAAHLPLHDGPATLKTFVEPAYPEDARQHNLGGVVTLRLHVDSSGQVADAAIEHGLGAAFDEAAVTAARRLVFHPARAGGHDVATDVLFEYRFTPPGHTHTQPSPATTAALMPGDATLEISEVDKVTIVESVEQERPLTAASARTVRDRDLHVRPIQRPSDLFRVTPGLLTVQHAGGGKANQYLLRGFDADHGTDVAFSFDGVPLNMVSHGHGQGYSDPNWIIPELVERVEVAKGPYFVEHGDFATAGAIDLVTRDRGESFVSAGGGSFGTLRGVGIASPTLGGNWHPLLAAEVLHTDGPFQNPEIFRKYNFFGKLTYDIDARSHLSFAATAYSGSWNASGQLPSRAVDSGAVDYFGTLDSTEGGASTRDNLYVTYQLRPDKDSEFVALAYLTHYDFTLYSNFTFFSRDPVNGDEIEQRDHRSITGAQASYRWLRQWKNVLLDSKIGGDARADAIANGLNHVRARARLGKVVDDEVNETSIGAYAKEEIQLGRWVRLVGGLRLDHFTFRVDDHLEDLTGQGVVTSGIKGATRFSPKAALILSPHPTTDLFFNLGYGFHSNDARGVVRSRDPVTPLTRTIGYEAGVRSRLLDHRLELAAVLWGIDIDSETVWVGDEGTTEAAAATRRLGVELEGRWELTTWLLADLDATLSKANFRENAGNAQAVALAPRLTVSGGLSAFHHSGLRGGLRGLYIAKRPATEDEFLDAEATTLVDLFAAYRWKSFELSLTIENVINRRYKAAQFATVTRLRNEPPTNAPPPAGACPGGTRAAADETTGNFQGCEDVSFSPGNPFNLRAMATYYF